MPLGDTSQYSTLLANMLAQARNRPIAPTGGKVLALGGHPVVENKTMTKAGVDLSGVFDLLGVSPKSKNLKAKTEHYESETMRRDSEMAWLHYNTGFSPEQLDKIYPQPGIQTMLQKLKDRNSPLVWHNEDKNRLEFTPMSPAMYSKVTGQKPLDKEQIGMLPPNDPRRLNYENFVNATRPKSSAELFPTETQRKIEAEGKKATEEAGAVPSLIELRKQQAGQAKATAGYLEGEKGKPGEIKQKTVNNIMDNFQKSFSSATKVDYRYGTEEYAQQLTNVNSATVNALSQLKAHGAKAEMAGVAGSWITRVNKELSQPPQLSGGKLTPSELSRITGIRDSIKQVIDAASMDIPDYQKILIADMINKVNQYLGNTPAVKE